ncbi:hypothetical protein ACN4EK_28525 [Pantanalinema rosaneae CENA516]|uniref:hypothetical protein n=1 Tax=Pantanalinema rosaneae TaxID=1620701 RepID=UPI003D6FA062
MSNDRRIPDRQPSGQSSEIREPRRSPGKIPARTVPGQSVNHSVPLQNGANGAQVGGNPRLAATYAKFKQRSTAQRSQQPAPGTASPAPTVISPDAPKTPFAQRSWWQWLLTWKMALVAAGLLTIGSSTLAVAYLLQLPGLPNCPAVFWPLASASMRFECARIASSKRTAKDLLEAIQLVDGLPADHPMRQEADRLIELWSQDVLDLAGELFNQGKLADAIAAARQIPSKVTAYKLVEDRIKLWQSIWAQGEEIYRRAEAAMRKREWRQAFLQAIRLLSLDCQYWQTTRYDDLTNRINTARKDGERLYEAERLADNGGLDNLLKAIKLARQIRAESYVFQEAQQAIGRFGRKMMNLAQATLEQKDLQGALDIVGKLPEEAKLEEEAKDFTILANAHSHVWQGTVAGLEEAIGHAQRIVAGRPYYQRAQQLITRWQLEIEALARLENARLLADQGDVTNLEAAIVKASEVQESNPRWNEAQQDIQKWRTQSETIQDRPILDLAEQYAAQGNINALQMAIAQASQIVRGRALYREAQDKIRQWNDQVERIQDQPFLEQARAYAMAGNLAAAIAAAEQVRSGRALYNEAQADIANWRKTLQAEANQIQAQQYLQQARQAATGATVDALAEAIRIANQVSGSTALRADADALINDWSGQLLQTAKNQAIYNPAMAIAIAQYIPSYSTAYSEAQTQIANWKALQQVQQGTSAQPPVPNR